MHFCIQWICFQTQHTTGKAKTQHDGPKLYTLLSAFWIPYKTDKSQLEKATSLWTMHLRLAALWLLPDNVCSIVCSRLQQGFSLKYYTCSAWFRAPLSSFRQVLLLFSDCWAQAFGPHVSVPIHIVKRQHCLCMKTIVLGLYIVTIILQSALRCHV